MSRTTATAVIKVLQSLFARFGLPIEVVSDQGPPFQSSEFGEFLQKNGIRQSFSPAYHPASNGAAENAVKLCKKAIKKAITDKIDVHTALQAYLLTYRNSIHSTTGQTPASILQRRTLRTRLDLLRSDRAVLDKVNEAHNKQTEYAGGSQRQFSPGEEVWARSYGGSSKWKKGTVINKEGSRRLLVKEDDGRQTTKHVDQLRRRSSLMSDVPCPSEAGVPSIVEESIPEVVETTSTSGKDPTPGEESGNEYSTPTSSPQSSPVPERALITPPKPVDRPKRVRKPIDRFKPG